MSEDDRNIKPSPGKENQVRQVVVLLVLTGLALVVIGYWVVLVPTLLRAPA
jgi:hypothetical protein